MSSSPPPPPTTSSTFEAKSDRESLPAVVSSAAPEQPGPSAADEGGELEGGGAEVEEEEECAFCLFMKGGSCKDVFVAWEKCVEDAEKRGDDIVDKCAEATALLNKCMEAHADYYELILRAEQAMVDAAAATQNPDLEEVEKGKDS